MVTPAPRAFTQVRWRSIETASVVSSSSGANILHARLSGVGLSGREHRFARGSARGDGRGANQVLANIYDYGTRRVPGGSAVVTFEAGGSVDGQCDRCLLRSAWVTRSSITPAEQPER